jgi:RNA polymerase sigma-70 factor (ECF subfamily)
MKYLRTSLREGNKSQATTGAELHDRSKIIKLVDRAAGGDSEAFGELYSLYLDPIYRYVYYQVRDKMTAEDVTEEVFIKAWKRIHSCRGKGQTFSSWLYRIAHNHVIDTLRRRRGELSLEEETITDISDTKQEIEEELERQEWLKVIDYLPRNQKQVIILKFIEGLDNQEIGQIMDKNQGAIRVLQMRALATLRQKLSTENQWNGY